MPKLKVITRWIALGLVMALGLAGVQKLTSDINTVDTDKSAYYKWGNAPYMDREWIEMASEYDVIQISPGAWAGREEQRKELIARNPNIEFGTYYNNTTCPPWMERGRPGSYPRRLWEFYMAGGRLAVTTTGDTASIWKNFPMFDIMQAEVRQGSIEILDDYVRENGITEIFVDYFSVPLTHYDLGYPGVEGELDLDRDGIAHKQDPDEQEALRRVWFEYVQELREVLPQGTRIIANGNLAVKDPMFTRMVDGVYLENFPMYFWGPGTAPNMKNALDPIYPNSVPQLLTRGVEVYLDNRGPDPRISLVADTLGVFDCTWPDGVN